MDSSNNGHNLSRKVTIGMRTFSALGLMVALIVSLGFYYGGGLKRLDESDKALYEQAAKPLSLYARP